MARKRNNHRGFLRSRLPRHEGGWVVEVTVGVWRLNDDMEDEEDERNTGSRDWVGTLCF